MNNLFVLTYKIIRIDHKEDAITKEIYNSYDEAYNAIEKIKGNICCSDTDIENDIYYEIIKTI
mgnify:FL=1